MFKGTDKPNNEELKLPIETWLYILSLLTPKDLGCGVGRANHIFYAMANDSQLWRSKFRQDFPSLITEEIDTPKSMYQFAIQAEHPVNFLRQLKQLSEIDDLEFITPYRGNICELNSVAEYAAVINSEEDSLGYFLKLFEELGVGTTTQYEGISIDRGIIYRFNQIIIIDLETLQKFKSTIIAKIVKEEGLITSNSFPPFKSEHYNKLTGNKLRYHHAIINILRSLVIAISFRDENFNHLITTLKLNLKRMDAFSFSTLTSHQPSPVIHLISFLKGLLKHPSETKILDYPYLSNLNISPSIISEITKDFITQELLTNKPFPISLLAYMLSMLRTTKAADGGFYKYISTEIELFSDADFISQNDGSIIINFKGSKSYHNNYAEGKKFAKQLDNELDHLFLKLGIEVIKINGSYHHGCIIPVLSVKKLQSEGVVIQAGLFNHELIAKQRKLYDILLSYSSKQIYPSAILPTLFSTASKETNYATSISAKALAEIFDFDIDLILNLKNGLCESIEIDTKDPETARCIAMAVRSKLQEINKRDYGEQISYGGLSNKEPVVEISFDALNDLIKLITVWQAQSTTSSSFQPQK